MSTPNENFADQRFAFSAPGLGKTGQYQMSGIPFVTASIAVNKGGDSPTKVSFPYVTKFVTVQNIATGSEKPLRVGFSELGTTGSAENDGYDNYYVLEAAVAQVAEIVAPAMVQAGVPGDEVTQMVEQFLADIKEAVLSDRDWET